MVGSKGTKDLAGDLVSPGLQNAFFGKTIEGIVDLNSRQSCGIIPQHLLVGEIFGVEASLPLFIAVSAGADAELHGGF